VTAYGHVTDAAGKIIDDVSTDDLFTLGDPASHPPTGSRYYGTVVGRISGYVLEEKLKFYRMVCV
jgi:hypothetical protein